MTADDAVPNFHDKESEVRYWKGRYYDLQDTLRETEATLHDFMDSSKELEKEMDREISAAQSKVNELQVKSEKLKGDVDEWKSRYQRALTDHNKTLAELNRELSTLRESHKIYKNQLRDLELNNDELENAERMVASSLDDMENRYNKAIERTAMLEEELLEKGRLEEENQRLKDALQEANEELAVMRDAAARARSMNRSSTPAQASSSNGRFSSDDQQLNDLLSRQRPSSRTSIRPSSRTGARASLAPSRSQLPSIRSSRDLASRATPTPRRSVAATKDQLLNISASKSMIGDMFGKMQALEKRLADSRNGMSVDARSAIPRPSSRLGASIGNTSVNLTPRRSMDLRRDEFSPPSSIPVPLGRPSSRRPSSRLSSAYSGTHIPSSVRSQTPTLESGANLDFLDQDPSKVRRRSHLSMATASEAMAAGNMSQITRPRGSTLTSRITDPLRKSINPGSGRPAPPISFKASIAASSVRQRSSSTAPN